jgi:hypothetical protein
VIDPGLVVVDPDDGVVMGHANDCSRAFVDLR